MLLDEMIKEYGFKNESEFYMLVSKVDVSTPEKLAAFKVWQAIDGTKTGILKLDQI